MKRVVLYSLALFAAASLAGNAAEAATNKQRLSRRETFSQKQAEAAQVHVRRAMSEPMADLLAKADFQHAEVMLSYGLALYLGRPSATANLSDGEKARLKAAYRDVLDLYLTSGDKFPNVTFDEDAMLENGDFWVYLAEHVGRPNESRRLEQTLPTEAGNSAGTSTLMLMPNNPNQSGENIGADLVIDRGVANAAISCATSAMAFARMKKAQVVDIAETKLTSEKFTEMRVTAARLYRSAYGTGVAACASKANFLTAAEFSAGNLGRLGAMKVDAAAVPVELDDSE
jgi:hypothetical protein